MRLRPDAACWMGPSTNSTLRVSDAERNEVADRLSRHFADGRLDQAEFKERLDAAMSAKTQGDLAGLFTICRLSPPILRRRLRAATASFLSSSWWPASPWSPARRSRSGMHCRSRGCSSPWWRSSSGIERDDDTITTTTNTGRSDPVGRWLVASMGANATYRPDLVVFGTSQDG